MQLIIDVRMNYDENTIYGWYVYGYINRTNGVISMYDTDTALVSVLNITSVGEYRAILEENGASALANGRTCFATKEMAQNLVSLIEDLINYDLIC